MQDTFRPYVTAGIALVSASVIVASPVTAPLPDIQIAAPPVQPTSTFGELIDNTVTSLSALLPALTEDPLPVLTQILANNVSSATAIFGPAADIAVTIGGYVVRLPITAVEAIQALFAEDGGVGAAISVLLSPLRPLVDESAQLLDATVAALQQPFQNIANALGTINQQNIALLGLSAVSPLIATVVATVDAVNAVVEAATGEDASVGATIESLVDFIPTVANGLLNGTALLQREVDLPFPLPDVVINGDVGGLLSVGDFNVDIGLKDATVNLQTSGPIAAVNSYLHRLAEAITPPPDEPDTVESAPPEPNPVLAEASVPQTADVAPQPEAPARKQAELVVSEPPEQDTSEPETTKARPGSRFELDKSDRSLSKAGASLKKSGDTVRKNLGKVGKPRAAHSGPAGPASNRGSAKKDAE